MGELLALAIAFPTVIFTVLLGVVLVYWLFVVLGALHVDLLGSGHDGVFEGAHIEAGHFDAGGADAGLDHPGLDVAEHGGIAGVVEALRLRSAPATVVASLLITFSWLASVLGVQAARHIAPGVPPWISGSIVFVLAILVALPITSFAVRPLARLFVPHVAKGRDDLVGKVCVIRTGSVDDTFGEATLEDGGAGLVVRVRVDVSEGAAGLARGDQALIVGWDEGRQAFTVAPMEELLAPPRQNEASKK
jgi:hypothetical protein